MATFAATSSWLKVEGDPDAEDEMDFRGRLQALLVGDVAVVTVDMSGVRMISSVCIGALIFLCIDLSLAGRRLDVVASPAVKKVLAPVGLTSVLMREGDP